MTDPTHIECPCCGDDGAVSNSDGEFSDGQALICGCPGLVSVDEDGEAWINNLDEACEKCQAEPMPNDSTRLTAEIITLKSGMKICGRPPFRVVGNGLLGSSRIIDANDATVAVGYDKQESTELCRQLNEESTKNDRPTD